MQEGVFDDNFDLDTPPPTSSNGGGGAGGGGFGGAGAGGGGSGGIDSRFLSPLELLEDLYVVGKIDLETYTLLSKCTRESMPARAARAAPRPAAARMKDKEEEEEEEDEEGEEEGEKEEEEEEMDDNYDICCRCLKSGVLLVACDFCVRSFCLSCKGLKSVPRVEKWRCGECRNPVSLAAKKAQLAYAAK